MTNVTIVSRVYLNYIHNSSVKAEVSLHLVSNRLHVKAGDFELRKNCVRMESSDQVPECLQYLYLPDLEAISVVFKIKKDNSRN